MDVKQGFMEINATVHVAWDVPITNVIRLEVVSADVKRGFTDISVMINVEKDAMNRVMYMATVTVKKDGKLGFVTVSCHTLSGIAEILTYQRGNYSY